MEECVCRILIEDGVYITYTSFSVIRVEHAAGLFNCCETAASAF